MAVRQTSLTIKGLRPRSIHHYRCELALRRRRWHSLTTRWSSWDQSRAYDGQQQQTWVGQMYAQDPHPQVPVMYVFTVLRSHGRAYAAIGRPTTITIRSNSSTLERPSPSRTNSITNRTTTLPLSSPTNFNNLPTLQPLGIKSPLSVIPRSSSRTGQLSLTKRRIRQGLDQRANSTS